MLCMTRQFHLNDHRAKIYLNKANKLILFVCKLGFISRQHSMICSRQLWKQVWEQHSATSTAGTTTLLNTTLVSNNHSSSEGHDFHVTFNKRNKFTYLLQDSTNRLVKTYKYIKRGNPAYNYCVSGYYPSSCFYLKHTTLLRLNSVCLRVEPT
jgi:hypothetical protein